MSRIALAVIYLIGTVVVVALMDADGDGSWGTIWLAVSVLLGAGTGDYRLAALALLAIPIAIPFGLPADRYADPVFPVWVAAATFAPYSAALILFSAFMRRMVGRRLQRWRAARDSGVA